MFRDYPKEYDEKLWEIAKAECERLEKERPKDLEYLKMYYGYSLHHFGFGMYLRNRYGNDFPKIERDYVGNEIMNRMTAILFPAFENNLGIISTVTFCSEFLNAECYLKYGDYLINMICWKDHFKIGDWSWTDPELEYFDSFERKAFADYFWERFKQEYEGFMSAAYEKILDYDNFRAAALKLGYSEDEILETRAISDEVFEKEQCYLPLEILYFKQPTAKSLECAMKLKSVFEWIAQWIFRLIKYIPDYAKECREFVQLITESNSNALKYFPKFYEKSDTV